MLEQVGQGQDIWTIDGPDMKPGGGVRFPARCTITRLTDGSVMIYSPVRFDDADADAIRHLGPVRHIVAPNPFHHVFLSEALARFPDARIFGPEPLRKKRHDLPVELPDTDGSPFDTDHGCAVVLIAPGPKLQELAVLHRPSRSLLVADLLFNIAKPRNWQTSLALRLGGTHGKLAQSRLWRLHTKDRQAARQAIERLLRLDFDRLIPCHGHIVATGAHAAVASALWWMREA